MRALADKVGRCRHCDNEIRFERYHAGFGDQGYMYCDRDSTVVTWSAYEPAYAAIAGNVNPWVLGDDAKRRVEDAVVECPHGGRFSFDALPRCPHCGSELPELAADPIYFVILADWLNGDSQTVWRDGELAP
jgi:hypothetical protein